MYSVYHGCLGDVSRSGKAYRYNERDEYPVCQSIKTKRGVCQNKVNFTHFCPLSHPSTIQTYDPLKIVLIEPKKFQSAYRNLYIKLDAYPFQIKQDIGIKAVDTTL